MSVSTQKRWAGLLAAMLAVGVAVALVLGGCGDGGKGTEPGTSPDGDGDSVFTIMFDANGGTVSPASGTTGEGGRLASLPMPARNNYTFDGWFTAALGDTEVTTNTRFTANDTIYARWLVISYPGTPLTYGGQTYNTVVIGNQTWMAENFNYQPSSGNSWCYGNNNSNCITHGRLYDWSTAMNGASGSSATPSGVQGVCPSGWHLPSHAEWGALVIAAGDTGTYDPNGMAGTKLKSTTGWNYYEGKSGNGTDDFGFSALPGGFLGAVGTSKGEFFFGGEYGDWWTTTEGSSGNAYSLTMFSSRAHMGLYNAEKSHGFSVRCVKD